MDREDGLFIAATGHFGLRWRGEGGDWGPRWIATDGTLRRSFVHYFSRRQFRREAERAGLRLDKFCGGRAELRSGRIRLPGDERK